MKNSAFLSRLKPVISDLHTRPYAVPALFVQRFGALLLDIGFIVGLAALYHIATHFLSPEAFETMRRPRYIPPHPDMGWSRMERSLLITGTIVSVMAAMIASPMRGTPGMMAFHLQASDAQGRKLRFPRSFAWVLLAFLPILAANYLLLAGIAAQVPLLHFNIGNWFGLNVFSLLVFLQNAWFFTVLIRRDKKAVPDIFASVRVVHKCADESGIPKIKRLLYIPFLALFGGIMIVTGGISAINLADAPIKPEILLLKAQKPQTANPLRATWKNTAAFEISVKITNFRCASKYPRFDVYKTCTQPQDIPALLQENQSLIALYEADLSAPASDLSRIHEKYLNQESVALTDLFLASLIRSIETDPAQAEAVFQRWLRAEEFWRMAIQKPGYLLTQSRALMHYSHILHAFPILAASAPDLVTKHEDELMRRFAPIRFNRDFLRGIMAYEYDVYERILTHSLIDYFPLIQPNDTRNQFWDAAQVYEGLLDDKIFSQSLETHISLLSSLRDQYRWRTLYNPLGVRFRDFAVENLQSNLYMISAYHNNNGLRQMLRLYVKAHVQKIQPEDMPVFLESLPPLETLLFKDSQISWSPELGALYYSLSSTSGLYHYLVF